MVSPFDKFPMESGVVRVWVEALPKADPLPSFLRDFNQTVEVASDS